MLKSVTIIIDLKLLPAPDKAVEKVRCRTITTKVNTKISDMKWDARLIPSGLCSDHTTLTDRSPFNCWTRSSFRLLFEVPKSCAEKCFYYRHLKLLANFHWKSGCIVIIIVRSEPRTTKLHISWSLKQVFSGFNNV